MSERPALTDLNITVVGLGLMGGSLAASLRGRCARVTGVDLSAETARRASERGLVDEATTRLEEGVGGADVIVLAAPVRAILTLLEAIPPYLKPGSLVMDLGSTKTGITRRMNDLPPGVQAIGGHPMCGKESSGVEAADPALYGNALFFLTPLARTSAETLNLAESLVLELKARPQIVEPERHDRLVAAVSHLPYLLAGGLVRLAEERAAGDTLIWQTASSGFRDTSRLAASNVTMMMDILMTNREAVLEMLNAYIDGMAHLSHLLADSDELRLRTELTAVQERRKRLF